MTQIRRTFLIFLVLLFLCAFLPITTPSSSAAAAATLILQSDTAANPILDHELDFATYHSGGPFTVSFQWKAVNLQPIDSGDSDSYGTVIIFGTSYGSINQQANPNLTISANTDWTTQSFTFQNVGTFSIAGTNMPGNFLRFALWNAKGELRIRHLTIQNAAGDVVYNLNTDPSVQRVVADMQQDGFTIKDFADISIEGYADFTWMAGQYGLGRYSAHLTISDGPLPTLTSGAQPSSTTIRPTTPVWPCTTGHRWDDNMVCQECSKQLTTGTKPVNTCSNASGHVYLNHYCMYCNEISPWYAGCLQGQHGYNAYKICVHCGYRDPSSPICPGEHTFRNGVCRDCGQPDPNTTYPRPSATYSVPTFPLTSTQPSSTKPGQIVCSTGHFYQNGMCIFCQSADPCYHAAPTTVTRPATRPVDAQSSLSRKPTTRPSIATNATVDSLAADANANSPVLAQPNALPEPEQDAPGANLTAAEAPATAQDFDSTWVIIIAVAALAVIGGIVALVIVKKR